MNRFFYLFRVFLFSGEMLLILVGVLINDHYPTSIQHLADAITIHENLENYLMLAPFGLALWIFLEIRNLLQEDDRTTNILTGWDEYWKLKVHTTVTIIYAVLFVLLSMVPWCTEFSLKTRFGFSLFVISLMGQLCVTMSIYTARIRMKEIIAKLN